MIEGEIIAPQHWQLTLSRIKEVRDFKKKHKLGIAIRVETNQNCDWNYLSLVLQFLEHSSGRCKPCFIVLMVYKLILQYAPETLYWRIVKAITFTTH